jgi:hypothetical protein
MHILPVGRSGLLFQQSVVGPAIIHGRIQVFAIHVAGKGARLAHQPFDNVPVIDPMLVLATQTRHALHQLLSMPHLDLFHADTRLDLFAA